MAGRDDLWHIEQSFRMSKTDSDASIIALPLTTSFINNDDDRSISAIAAVCGVSNFLDNHW